MTHPSGTPDDRDHVHPASPSRDFDALAELFLGEHETGSHDAGPIAIPFPREQAPTPLRDTSASSQNPMHEHAPHPPTVEALLMGHLPVRSGPWALQYAASVARHEHTGVTLVRLSPCDDTGNSRISIDLLGPQPAWTSDVNPNFREAMAHAQRSSQRWIVLVSELDEATVTSVTGIDRVTVLSGANEAAVVDAYRMFKSMASEDVLDAMPSVCVAIMGADAERSEAAGRKLQHGARTFLNMDIELAKPLGKMGPTGSISLFRGAVEVNAERLVTLIQSTRPQVDPVPAQSTLEENLTPTKPRPSTIAEPKTPALSHLSPLVALIDGLTALDLECPASQEVQFAADAHGQLHVLADGERAVQALSQASAWATMHHALIARATGIALREADAVQHLFATQAASVRWLLDSPVRVHLLTQVNVRGEVVPVACALN